MLNTVRSWLGLTEAQAPDHSPLREVVDALDRLEPERARYLARFAYLLGRVAHADRHVSPEETAAMEAMVRAEGQLSSDQAMLVVSLAKSSNALFGGTADFTVAQEFNETATYEEKLALARCLFAVGATDASISLAEESEIHRITNHLKIDRADLTAIRLQHRQALPGIARPGGE
ncbi:MAG: TerB family tellurite resistance protein [Vicinamibacterales bacterium]